MGMDVEVRRLTQRNSFLVFWYYRDDLFLARREGQLQRFCDTYDMWIYVIGKTDTPRSQPDHPCFLVGCTAATDGSSIIGFGDGANRSKVVKSLSRIKRLP